MRLRPFIFIISFAVFYLLLHLAYDIPNLIHGSPRFLNGPGTAKQQLATTAIDFLFSFLFAAIPYSAFYRFYPGRKFAAIFLSVLLLFPVIFFVRYGLESGLLTALQTKGAIRLRHYFLDHLFYIILYLAFGVAFYFVRYSYFREMQQKELALQNRESELSFLRSQINPHFLFNSLNNIYSLVYLGSPRSLEAIAGFSEMLRYMLYDTLKDVPLEKEVHYIRQFIALQELKNEGSAKTTIDADGPLGEVFIPPLLLIPFVENAYKHGNAEQEGIVLSVKTDGRQTSFYCQNKKSTGRKDATGGIGLQNVKRRLELLYPDKHRLSVMDGPSLFIIKLEIDHE